VKQHQTLCVFAFLTLFEGLRGGDASATATSFGERLIARSLALTRLCVAVGRTRNEGGHFAQLRGHWAPLEETAQPWDAEEEANEV
jgi:hypothetical protein